MNPFGIADAVCEPSKLKAWRFHQVMEYKPEIRHIINHELYGKYRLCMMHIPLMRHCTLLTMLSPTGMHPFQTMRIDEKGNMIQMDVFEYLFKHAQRLPEKKLLSPINSFRYVATVEMGKNNHINELMEEENGEKENRKLFQRGLGLFNTLVVRGGGTTNPTVTCTCENFSRFGTCQDSDLIGFICLGREGEPAVDKAVDFIDCQDGYDVASERLRQKVLDLVDSGSVTVQAPPKDPYQVMQNPPCALQD